jgi:hypothetical protein
VQVLKELGQARVKLGQAPMKLEPALKKVILNE